MKYTKVGGFSLSFCHDIAIIFFYFDWYCYKFLGPHETFKFLIFCFPFYCISTVDGKEVGSIQSKLLCRSILDLYIGDEPFDRHAKEEIEVGLASLLVK